MTKYEFLGYMYMFETLLDSTPKEEIQKVVRKIISQAENEDKIPKDDETPKPRTAKKKQ